MNNNTVDNLEIEIEASSSEAEKKVTALVDTLERLKKATSGFGNVSERIRGIREAAGQSSSAAKMQKKQAALERATDSIGASKSSDFKADGISRELDRVDKAIEKTSDKLLSLQGQLESLEQMKGIGLPETRSETLSQIGTVKEQLDQYSKLQDSLDVQRRTLLKSLEDVNNAPVKLKVDSSDISEACRKINRLRKILESVKRIVFYRAIRSVITSITDGFKTGIQNMYKFSEAAGTKFKSAMDQAARHGVKFCVSDIRQSQGWRCGNRAECGAESLVHRSSRCPGRYAHRLRRECRSGRRETLRQGVSQRPGRRT